MILKRGHESVIEHSNMTVQFNNISRGFTHEQVRHRLTAISQESTRYVDYAKEGKGPDLENFQLKCVVPPHRDENEKIALEDGRIMSISEMFAEYESFYRALRKAGWLPQDARQVLPIGTKSQIVISANFREWRHIFTMRTQETAHWEIRKVMGDLLEKVKTIIPEIFDDFVEAEKPDQNGLRYFEKRSM
jgi:thymidylate synthase (FAD)